MEAISVNHRYMFTKELFDGSREAFTEAIAAIEACESFDDAVELLVQTYAKERAWDMNSEEVKELLKVVFRKFR
jgi:VIT1/CCC1 family predicted Fe2+/Mn2+ transporter